MSLLSFKGDRAVLWIFAIAIIVNTIYIINEPPIEPKIYKNGYEVVKIGGCEYLRDVGFFHETLVHDGECQNHCK